MDSMLVYKGLDVGTAKPSQEERERVPHHLMDLVPVNEPFDVQRYLLEARNSLSGIQSRSRRGLFVGGTGMYLAALLRGLFEGPAPDLELRKRLEGEWEEQGAQASHEILKRLDPASAQRLHPNDQRRVVRAMEVWHQTGRTLSDWQAESVAAAGQRAQLARVVGLALEPDVLEHRIRARAEIMVGDRWQDEAVRLSLDPGFGPSASAALGYSEILAWSRGELTRQQALDQIVLRTRQFARRQRTWYRKFDVTWIQADAPDCLEQALHAFT